MEIRVLGDLTIDGGRLSPKERSLLAVLVLRSGNVVTPSELADAIWGDDLPSTWPKQVQAMVVQIRRALGAASVMTTRGGYRLGVEPESIDVVRYERLVESASAYRANGDPVRAIDVLERAASLWSGVPYSDLGEWPAATTEADRLDEIRSSAEEDVLGARLECGEHRSVVPDAERLVRTEPLRERRWAILATALYRSGRQADALAALRSARERLADELGIEPGTELVALESAILHQDPSLDAPPESQLTSADCPYRGLQPFGTEDSDAFFGRDADISAALSRLSRSPFLAIAGASGSGKSSLLLAGIVPALRARGDTVTILGSGSTPLPRLRDAFSGRGRADVVVIDQFEELFHAGLADSQVAEFCVLCAEAIAGGQRLVLAVRSDFLNACANEPSIGPLFAAGVHLVGPLAPDGLRSAIEEPARLAGLRLEPGLVELILRDAAGAPAVLPHVSHALVETWLRREGATLTVAGYEASGGIAGAIAKSADHLYLSLDPEARSTCRATFLRLVEISTDGVPMRRRIPILALRQDAAHERVLASLAGARLVSAEEDSLIMVHESLATAWPRLRDWLEHDAEGLRTMRALAGAADDWEADGRPEESLYRGVRLATALAWRDADSPELTPVESTFLDASLEQETTTLAAIERRAARDRRQNRRLRVALGASVILFVVSVVAGGLVAAGANETERQRTTARIEALTSTSLSLRATEPDVAALLAAEAHHRWPDDPRTRSALMGVMTASNGLLASGHPSGGREIAGVLIPGSRHAVIVTAIPDVQVVDVDTMDVIRVLDIPRNGIFIDSRLGPAVSADGTRVAVVEQTLADGGVREGGRLYVAEIATGERILGPIDLGFLLSTLALSPDGSTVAAIDEVGTLRLIDVADGTERAVSGIPTHEAQFDTDRAGTVRFAPGGRLLYGNVEGQLLVVDPVSATVAATIAMPPESTNIAMAVVSDSRVVTAGDSRVASVDIDALRVDWSHEFAARRTDRPCNWIAVSVELDAVYCGDLHGTIAQRSLSSGAPGASRFSPQLGYVGPMSVTNEGRELVVIGRGSPTITRWSLDGSGSVARLLAPGWTVMGEYAPAGSKLIVAQRVEDARSAQAYEKFAVLDTRSGVLSDHLPTPSRFVSWASADAVFGLIGGVDAADFGFLDTRSESRYSEVNFPDDVTWIYPDAAGTRLFLARANGEIWTIDPATGARIEPTFDAGGQVSTLTTSPDGGDVLVTAWITEREDYLSTMFDGHTGEVLRTGLEGASGTLLTARGEVLSKMDTRMVLNESASFSRVGSLPAVQGGGLTASVTADGRTMSAYSPNETVSIYDLVAGIRIGDPIRVSSEWTWSGMLRDDGEELAINSSAGVVVWDLRPEVHADAACRMAGRDLTQEEWNSYLGEVGPYRSTCGFGER